MLQRRAGSPRTWATRSELENTRVGEILFSSTLGVSTKAGATA